MAEGDQLSRPLAPHDSGEPCDFVHAPLRHRALLYRLQGFPGHAYDTLCRREAESGVFRRHVHHAGLSLRIQVGEIRGRRSVASLVIHPLLQSSGAACRRPAARSGRERTHHVGDPVSEPRRVPLSSCRSPEIMSWGFTFPAAITRASSTAATAFAIRTGCVIPSVAKRLSISTSS